MAKHGDRQYDIIVLGATGYSGKYTCQHLVDHAPTNLRWAVAGRSRNKLDALSHDLKQRKTDRIAPGIEICTLSSQDLEDVTQKTHILLTTVGPYSRYGTPVFEACLKTKTHYFDITGETPWLYEMIKKHHEEAKREGIIMIPQIGVDSAPADLMTWCLAKHIRDNFSSPTAEVIFTLHKMRTRASGGTLESVLSLLEMYSIKQVREALKPWSLSPVQPLRWVDDQRSRRTRLLQSLTGLQLDKELGILTTSLQASVDRTQVYRTWGLLDDGNYYGNTFRFRPFMTARGIISGFLIHLAITIAVFCLIFPTIRALVRKLIYGPGDGPTLEETKNDYIEWRAVATAETKDPSSRQQVSGKLRFKGSAYHLTAIFLAEAAISLLNDDSNAKEMGGGILTPATLGMAYVERLQKAGINIDTFLP